jgi:hypothetical protein
VKKKRDMQGTSSFSSHTPFFLTLSSSQPNIIMSAALASRTISSAITARKVSKDPAGGE